MTKSISIITAVALTIAVVVAWANASIRADAALKTLGPMVTDAQIDTIELTKTAHDLPAQEFAAY